MHLVEEVHSVLLTGGSTFGLAAADGVVRWLEKHNVGFDAGVTRIPIVPGAALFDLAIGRCDVRPDARMGIAACYAATQDFSFSQGTVGAGTGATVGQIVGPNGRMKGGLGTSVIRLDQELVVGAIFVVNCFGDVVNPSNGQILAGARNMPGGTFANTLRVLYRMPTCFAGATRNTVLGVVATNATLTKDAISKVAQMAQNGIARTISPANTMFDGDTIFALATGEGQKADVNIIGALAAEATARAIVNGIQEATSLGGVIALRDICPQLEANS
jgi:L-aminopeptidase/D-esterase-like protein